MWLGIDIGTTNVKAVALNEAGDIVAQASAACVTYHPRPNFVEQYPDEIYGLFVEVLRQVTTQLTAQNAKVQAVSLCSAMHSVIAIDAHNTPLTKSMLWADNRSEAQTDALKQFSQLDKLYRQTGIPLHPYSPLTKVRWLHEKKAGLSAKTTRYISQKEYIWYKLFGQYQIDHSMASGAAFLDNKRLKWSQLALDYAQIKAQHLSDIVPVYHVEYLTKPSLCRALGLPVGTPFVIGAGDGCLANLGAGALGSGISTLTIGTSGAVRQTTDKPATDPQRRLFTYVLDETHYVSGGPTNNGGNVLEWLSKYFLHKDPAALMALAEQVSAGADGLVFVPYLLGERAPVWDAHVRGSYQNVSWQHTQNHFIRATIEGILLNLNQIRKIIDEQMTKTQIVYANGGFTKSAFGVQLLADIFDVPIRINENTEGGCLGAILLAMKSLGAIGSLQQGVNRYVRFAETYRPNATHRRTYKKVIKEWQKYADR